MENELLVSYYTIDNKDYLVVNETEYENNHYVYLCNETDNKDLMIRKVIDNKLIPLDNEEELNSVIKLLVK